VELDLVLAQSSSKSPTQLARHTIVVLQASYTKALKNYLAEKAKTGSDPIDCKSIAARIESKLQELYKVSLRAP
jgi:hypothetical protein